MNSKRYDKLDYIVHTALTKVAKHSLKQKESILFKFGMRTGLRSIPKDPDIHDPAYFLRTLDKAPVHTRPNVSYIFLMKAHAKRYLLTEDVALKLYNKMKDQI